MLERVREICLGFPSVTEKVSHGEPTWFVGTSPSTSKVFVMYADRHHDDRVAFWCAAGEGMQAVLTENEPGLFFHPPYVGGRGWIGVYLDTERVDWDRIAEVIEDAYRQIAPKRLIAELDAST